MRSFTKIKPSEFTVIRLKVLISGSNFRGTDAPCRGYGVPKYVVEKQN